MTRNLIETVLGAVVIVVAAIFLGFAYFSSDLRPVAGYTIRAKFNAIDGLAVGNDVRIGGVKIGTVVSAALDPQDYRAVVTMTIRPEVKLPKDTTVKIASEGLLGGKHVKLEPGNDAEMVADGGALTKTKDVVSLEELLGKVIFLVTDESPR